MIELPIMSTSGVSKCSSSHPASASIQFKAVLKLTPRFAGGMPVEERRLQDQKLHFSQGLTLPPDGTEVPKLVLSYDSRHSDMVERLRNTLRQD